MPRDYGDSTPSDSGDVKPAAPTVDYSESTTKRIGRQDKRVTTHYGFDDRLNINEEFQPIRHSWVGTILDYNNDGTYSVMRQDGEEITAKDRYSIPNYGFLDMQTVMIVAGPKGGDYYIVGQKFFIGQEVEFAKLTEILIVGEKALAKRMYSTGDKGWEESSEEVDLYDPFSMNYGLIDEIFPYTYNIDTQTATIIGSQGIQRFGVTSEAISADDFGYVDIHDKDGEVTDASVIAYLTWMHNSQNLASGKQVIVRWHVEHFKWIIIGREC